MFLDTVSIGAKQIDSKNISTKDVTTEYIDLSTRLKNKKILETRYLQLLKQASKVSDILEIENKLNEIRTDIESNQGQLNYLSKQVAYSSLDITFYSKAKPTTAVKSIFLLEFKKAITNGWDYMVGLFFDAIACWPILFFGAIFYLIYRIWKKRKAASTL